MSPEEIDKRERWILENCICMQCPSWVECGERGGFCYFTIGKSGCIEKEKGCICGGCVVHAKLEHQHLYFCTRDSEKVQIGR